MSQETKQIFASFIILTYLLHLLGCLFAITGNISEGFEYESWLQVNGFDQFDMQTKYLISFYWAAVTCATVGYGDITPTNVIEITICIVLLLIGVTCYSYIISNLSRLVSNVRQDSTSVSKENLIYEFA